MSQWGPVEKKNKKCHGEYFNTAFKLNLELPFVHGISYALAPVKVFVLVSGKQSVTHQNSNSKRLSVQLNSPVTEVCLESHCRLSPQPTCHIWKPKAQSADGGILLCESHALTAGADGEKCINRNRKMDSHRQTQRQTNR